MIDKKILKILNTETKDLKETVDCPANPQFKHYIGTGMSAQCGQCGGCYKCPKPYTNEQKSKALKSLLKEYAMEIIGEDEGEESSHDFVINNLGGEVCSRCGIFATIPSVSGPCRGKSPRNQLRAEQREKVNL